MTVAVAPRRPPLTVALFVAVVVAALALLLAPEHPAPRGLPELSRHV
jgi:hypothetical protein